MVGVGETRRRLFARCVLRFIGPEAISTFLNHQIYDELKAGIDRKVHEVQTIWYTNYITEDWGFILVDGKTRSVRLI